MTCCSKSECESNQTQEKTQFPATSPGYCCRPCCAPCRTESSSRFSGRTAWILGGSGTFGASCALRLMREGCHVVLSGLDGSKEKAKEITQQAMNVKAGCAGGAKKCSCTEGCGCGCQTKIGKVVGIDCDVRKAESVEKAISDGLAELTANEGGDPLTLHYVFNNAGIQGEFGPTHDFEMKDFTTIADVNTTGVFNVLKAASKLMIDQQSKKMGASTPGCDCTKNCYPSRVIVNTCSTAATTSPHNAIAYSASKAAVRSMTTTAAKDLAKYNIRVNSVSPAFIAPCPMWDNQVIKQAEIGTLFDTQNPTEVAKRMRECPAMKRTGSVDEVVGPVLFLFSDDASYCTGIDIEIGGGL